MDKQFDLLTITRKNILAEVEACTLEQLFKIPTGFNNHIIWNVMHLIVTQQLLIYANTRTPFLIDQRIIDQYRKGTTPTSDVDDGMLTFAKKNFLPIISSIQSDYQKGIFGPYNSITTSYGVTINSVEEAIIFINLHESMHLGQIKMLRRLV